jgi:uncharacterized protein YwqG
MTHRKFSLDDLPPELKKHERLAWGPVTREGDGSPTQSKFSGMPWLGLKQNRNWPVCPACSRPMYLFLQLNVSTLPSPIKERSGGDGLLQLFYCTHDGEKDHEPCDSYEPFNRYSIVRVVHPNGDHNAAISPPAGAFPARVITGWRQAEDFPHILDLEAMGVSVPRELEETLADSDYPLNGDKLGGWPDWLQGADYPYCPRCGVKMQLLFQLTSEGHLPYLFGDSGTGYVTQCPAHRDVVAFSWNC